MLSPAIPSTCRGAISFGTRCHPTGQRPSQLLSAPCPGPALCPAAQLAVITTRPRRAPPISGPSHLPPAFSSALSSTASPKIRFLLSSTRSLENRAIQPTPLPAHLFFRGTRPATSSTPFPQTHRDRPASDATRLQTKHRAIAVIAHRQTTPVSGRRDKLFRQTRQIPSDTPRDGVDDWALSLPFDPRSASTLLPFTSPFYPNETEGAHFRCSIPASRPEEPEQNSASSACQGQFIAASQSTFSRYGLSGPVRALPRQLVSGVPPSHAIERLTSGLVSRRFNVVRTLSYNDDRGYYR